MTNKNTTMPKEYNLWQIFCSIRYSVTAPPVWEPLYTWWWSQMEEGWVGLLKLWLISWQRTWQSGLAITNSTFVDFLMNLVLFSMSMRIKISWFWMSPPGDETSLVALAAKEGASPSPHQVVDSYYAVLCILCCEILTNKEKSAWQWTGSFHTIILMNNCSFVNLAEVVAFKPEFVRALEARKSNREVGDK